MAKSTIRRPPLRRTARGSTLLEAVIAMAVLTIGSMGSMAIYRQNVMMEGDSRKITRAAAIAQDMVNQIQSWSYDDVRLSNDHAENDAAIGDPEFGLERSADPLADKLVDHDDGDLRKSGLTFNGLDPLPSEYQRYWSVDTANDDTPDAQHVAVIVRWPAGAGFRRIVMMVTKPNPAAVTR